VISNNSHFFKTFKTIGWIGLLLLVGSACSNKNLIKPGDTLDVAYKKAKNLYDNQKYSDASDAFETVISIGRGTDIGREAQYLLAESYFKNGEYLLAASEYGRFANLYPRAENRQQADFQQALCYYKLSPSYNLDQSKTRKAIDQFKLYLSRYPDADNAQQVAGYIDDMRAKLARKTYGAADLYMRIDEYEAAAIYYGLTIDQYPETAWAERALVDQIYAYVQYADNSIRSKQAERYQKAIDSYEKYVQLFPQGDHRSQAEDYYDLAKVGLSKAENKSSSSDQLTQSNNNADSDSDSEK